MDHIDKVLTSSSDSPYKFSIAIRAALAIGKQTMNRYYNKTDHSEVYRIAMGKVPLFEFSCQCLPTILLQFSTPVTSLNISRPRNGKTSGSMLHATSFVKNSTIHMHQLPPLGQETQVLLAGMLCRWTALTWYVTCSSTFTCNQQFLCSSTPCHQRTSLMTSLTLLPQLLLAMMNLKDTLLPT